MDPDTKVEKMTCCVQAVIDTGLGRIRGNRWEYNEDGRGGSCLEFLGVPFAKAGRFEYAKPLDRWEACAEAADGKLDATHFGPACPQYRQYDLHLEEPMSLFYHREFREGMEFTYDEDCLNLNIFVPEGARQAPVIVFFYGGGFNSGSNSEEPFRGYGFAKRGVITVFANYRVGALGYLTHGEISRQFGREGNFGLDDQVIAVKWVRAHIADFGGDPETITLMGQSAGAISIQYLCLDHKNEGLFKRVVMISGGGMFPRFALPKKAEDTRNYWLELMPEAGCGSFAELKELDIKDLLAAAETLRYRRKDTIYHTMPVVDGYLLEAPVDSLINHPLDIGYMIGYTNNDLYAPVMAYIGNKFGRANGAYIYYFDVDAPGDRNAAFHSSDLRYMLGRLDQSWRPYDEKDRAVSELLTDCASNFARCGDPNTDSTNWEPAGRAQKKAFCIRRDGARMGHPNFPKMAVNMLFKGAPKA